IRLGARAASGEHPNDDAFSLAGSQYPPRPALATEAIAIRSVFAFGDDLNHPHFASRSVGASTSAPHPLVLLAPPDACWQARHSPPSCGLLHGSIRPSPSRRGTMWKWT